MNNACSSNSKPPFTKLMDLVSNYSISFWTHLLEKKHLGHQKKSITSSLIEDTFFHNKKIINLMIIL